MRALKSLYKLVDKIVNFNPVICHTPRLVQDEVQIEGFFTRGLILGLQQPLWTAQSQHPQARVQPAPRAARLQPTLHHPVARAGGSLWLTAPWAPGSALPVLQRRDAKEEESPGTQPGVGVEWGWDACSRLSATQQLPQREKEVLGGQRERPRPPQLPPELGTNPSGLTVQSCGSGFRRVAADNEARGDSSQDKFFAALGRVSSAHPGPEG